MIRRPQILALLATVLALASCRAKDDFKNPSGGAAQNGAETPAPAPAPVQETPSDVTAFVPATDSVEITGANLEGGGFVARLSVLTAGYQFMPVGTEVSFDPAARSAKLGALVPRAFGPTTPIRVEIVDAATRAVRLCGDTYAGATALVLTRATKQGCGLLDLALSGEAGRALLPVIDLRTLAELGQVVRVAGAESNSALIGDVVASFLKVRAAQRSTQTNTLAQEADRLAAEVAATNVDSLRVLVDNGRWSEVAPGRSANPGATSAVVRDVSTGSTAGGTTLAYALAAITIQAATGKTITVAELIASGVSPGVLLIAADSALSGSSQELLTSVVTLATASQVNVVPRPPNASGLVLTPGVGTVTATWNAPGAGLQVLLIHRSGSAVEVTPVDGKSYTSLLNSTFEGHTVRVAGAGAGTHVDAGLMADVVQHYALWTYDATTGRYAETASRASAAALAPSGPPDTVPPGAFALSAPAPTVADLTPTIAWSASTDAVAYDVKVRVGGCMGSIALSATGLTTTTHTFATNLTDETTYCFEVISRDAAGNTAVAHASATLSLTRPGPPLGLNVNAGNTQNILAWTNAGKSYLVVRRLGSSVSFSPIDGTDYAANPVNDGQGNVSIHSGAYTAPVSDGSLANGSTYHYAVWSFEMPSLKYSAAPSRAIGVPMVPGAVHLSFTYGATASYVTNASGSWTVSAIGTASTSALALDASNRPSVALTFEPTGNAAHFSRLDNGIWTTGENFTNGALGLGIAIGPLDVVSFMQPASGAHDMRYWTRSITGAYAGPFVVETPESTAPMRDPVLLHAANGHLHAAWRKPLLGSERVTYARFDGTSWVDLVGLGTNGLDTCTSVAGHDLALDASDAPHIAFHCDTAAPSYVYVRKVGATWSFIEIAPSNGCARSPSILGREAGAVDVFYTAGADCDLFHVAIENGIVSAPYPVDDGPSLSYAPQAVRDASGMLRVFYLHQDMSSNELREAAKPMSGSWSGPMLRVDNLPPSAVLGRGVGVSGMAHESRPR